jgi:hypothetical protein
MTSSKWRLALGCDRRGARSTSPRSLALLAVFVCVCSPVWAHLPPLGAASARADVTAPRLGDSGQAGTAESEPGSSLEAAAAKAGDTGRAVAMSLIGLAFAVAAIVLAFRRDFKEAGGVFAVGIVSVLLATPTGVSLLRDTVKSVFGG